MIQGELPIIIHVNSADIMAKLIALKAEIEAQSDKTVRMAFFGALEAHILAKEIADAGVAVIVSP